MAEEEAIEAKKEEGNAESSGPVISKKGWVIVIAVVVLEAVFFGLVLFINQSDTAKKAMVLIN